MIYDATIPSSVTLYFDAIRTRNTPVVSLEILEPNLESVFLHLTGKRLRN